MSTDYSKHSPIPVTFIHLRTHSYTDGTGCGDRCWSVHQEAFSFFSEVPLDVFAHPLTHVLTDTGGAPIGSNFRFSILPKDISTCSWSFMCNVRGHSTMPSPTLHQPTYDSLSSLIQPYIWLLLLSSFKVDRNYLTLAMCLFHCTLSMCLSSSTHYTCANLLINYVLIGKKFFLSSAAVVLLQIECTSDKTNKI